jgi:hypothetical protein
MPVFVWPSAQGIDITEAPDEYREQVAREAKDIIDAWHSTKGSLRSSLRGVPFSQGLTYSIGALKTHPNTNHPA